MGNTIYYLAHIPTNNSELLDVYSVIDSVCQANGFTFTAVVEILHDVMEISKEEAEHLVKELIRKSCII